MTRFRLRRTAAIAITALLGVLSACGGGGDGRDRNVDMIVGTACSAAGEMKTVSKDVNVCGRNGSDLIWFRAVSRKPKGDKCGKPGAYKAAKGKSFVCGTVKKQRMWIEVTPMQVGVATTVPVTEAGDASGVPSTDSATSAGEAVPTTVAAGAATNAPEVTLPVPPAKAQVVAAAVPATALKVVSAPTEARNGQVLASPIVVQVSTAAGDARKVPGITVSITSLRADVSIAGRSAVTDEAGRATFDAFKLVGSTVSSDSVSLEISATDLDSTSVTLAIRPGVAERLNVVSNGSTTVAGEIFPDVVRVALFDVGGAHVPTAGIVVTAVDSSTKKEVGKATTSADGEAVFDRLMLTKAGATRLTFSSGSLISDVIAVTVLPSNAAGVTIVTPPSPVMQSGIPSSVDPRVQLVDQYGNAIARKGVRVVATLADRWPSPKATLADAVATTDESGKATFTEFTLAGFAVERYSIEFSMGAGSVTAVADVQLFAGLPAAVEMESIPDYVRSGAKSSVPIRARLVDKWHNWIQAKGVSLTLSTSALVRTTGTSATTGEDGIATFDDFVVIGDATKVTSIDLKFSSGDLVPVSTTVDLLSGYAKSLVFLSRQETVLVDRQFTVATSVLLVDEFGFPAINSTTEIFNWCGGKEMTSELTWVAKATFSKPTFHNVGWDGCDFIFNRVVGGAIMYRAAVYVASKTDIDLVCCGAVSNDAVNGVALDVQPYAIVRTANGMNPGAGLTVTARIADQPGAGASLANATATTDAKGYAYFQDLTITGKVGRYVLELSVENGGSFRTKAIDLAAGVGVGFVIVRDASDVNSGSTFDSMPALQIVDQSGNPVARDGVIATMTLPGTSPISVEPDAKGVLDFGSASKPVIRGVAKSITPTYSLIDTATNAVLYHSPGAPYTLHPGHLASGSVSVPRPFDSGTAIPAFSLLDSEGNVIEESANLEVEYSYRPAPGTLVWVSGTRKILAVGGRADFGDQAVLHGLPGSEISIEINQILGGSPIRRLTIARFTVKFADGPKPGEVGPAGGWIVYKSSTVIDAAPGISSGGHYLELAPSWWESTPTAHRFATSTPNYPETAFVIGEGANNTAILLKELDDPESAAAVAANLDLNNFVDWFLPTMNELGTMKSAGIKWGTGSEESINKWSRFWTSTINANGYFPVILKVFKVMSNQENQLWFDTDGSSADTRGSLEMLRPMRAFG